VASRLREPALHRRKIVRRAHCGKGVACGSEVGSGSRLRAGVSMREIQRRSVA